MVGTPPHPCSATYPTSDSDSRIRVGVPWPPTQPHRSKLLCRCAANHDEACGQHPSDVVVLGVIHPHRSYTMFENLALGFVLVVAFIGAPLLIAAIVAYGQGEDQ